LISDRAVVNSAARVGRNVAIGPFALVEPDVTIGDDCVIGPRVVLRTGAEIGDGCHLGVGAVVGEPPLDFAWRGETSRVRLGRNNDVREYVTIHRATGRDAATVIGDGNLIMPYVHIAHNCRIGNRTTITNACQLAGYVEIGDGAVLGGMTGVHQYVRIGACAMAGACSYLARDLPPFLLGAGNPFRVRGINSVGLRRAGFRPEQLKILRELYRFVYRSERNLTAALNDLPPRLSESPEVRQFIAFARSSRRGLQLREE
jgi:UDP-N-acetylglucosamine acyltransferase